MITDINRGIGMQIFSNAISAENNGSSFATTYKSIDFNDHNDLVLTSHYSTYVPQYLVLNMFNWINQFSNNDNLFTIYNLIHNLNLTFNVGYRVILQFPIKFLWGLRTPIIEDSKIYIHIPFDMFFGKIQIGLLSNNDVHFSVNESNELHNYARNYSMIMQIFMSNPYTSNLAQSLQNSMVHPIQQLSTIQVSSANALSGANNNMINEFRIKTDVFQGRTRGLFISCNVSALVHLRFYINNVLRDDYDAFFINHFCKKINDQLLYFPFNGSNEYLTRNFGSADGALDFSCLNSSILHLQFCQPQQRVSVYNLYFNEFRMHYGLGGLLKNTPPRIANINNSDDAIIPVVPNIDMMDLSGNIIVLNQEQNGNGHPQNGNGHPQNGNVNHRATANSIFVGATATGFVNTGTVTGTVGGQTGPGPGPVDPVYPVHIESVINMEVGERDICNITHEQIGEGHRYMSCGSCQNNFSETAILTWLRKKPEWSRTCPTCRNIWDNYYVYVNNPLD
jgi:hypothetical protein